MAFGQQAEKPQVLFSGPPKAEAPAPAVTATSKVTDDERRSVAVTAWDLDVHLTPAQQSMEAHARVMLRNQGTSPLELIPLQLSSSLHFETIGLEGKRLAYTSSIVNSDVDHTGQLVEAAAQLPEALAPGASVTLEVDYGGTVPLSAQRLLALGAPEAKAQASDWDRISADFTGLRGFGDVVWYPVCSVPALLGDGAKVFDEIGRQKLLDQDATVALRMTDEFTNEPPNAVILNGHFIPGDKPQSMPTASFPGVVTASLPAERIGFDTPSLFLARRTEVVDHGLRVLSTDADAANVKDYMLAAETAAPLLKTWLGSKTHAPATILDLPEPDDAPAETGNLLTTPLESDPPQSLEPAVLHALAHAAFDSRRAWLDEGVANFLNTLWIDSSDGHTAAMENLNSGRTALAVAEPATPGQATGQDLLNAVSPIYYRTKATYVMWMLRNMVGDVPLQSALQSYVARDDTSPDYFEHLVEKASSRDLSGFFSDWVNQDKGLPDLSIGGIYPTSEAHQQTLVAVDIVNNGYVEATVPVTVRAEETSATDWVRVPAHGRITHRILFTQIPSEVDLNDGSVPEVQDSVHRKMLTPASAQAQ